MLQTDYPVHRSRDNLDSDQALPEALLFRHQVQSSVAQGKYVDDLKICEGITLPVDCFIIAVMQDITHPITFMRTTEHNPAIIGFHVNHGIHCFYRLK